MTVSGAGDCAGSACISTTEAIPESVTNFMAGFIFGFRKAFNAENAKDAEESSYPSAVTLRPRRLIVFSFQVREDRLYARGQRESIGDGSDFLGFLPCVFKDRELALECDALVFFIDRHLHCQSNLPW